MRKQYSIIIMMSLFISTTSADIPTLGDSTLNIFSKKQERQLGLAFYQSLRANLTFVDDIQINHYLNNIGQRLASHSDAAGDKFNFFIIKASTINAFAGPAAYIGIHSQLMLEAQNESQLASVLAHEIAHVSQRHLARAFENANQSNTLTIASLLAAILIGTEDPQAGQAVLMSGIAGNQQSLINFTRSNEYEADRIGINILTDTNINPQGMVEFFEILLNKNPDNNIEYLRTHPLSSNRVAEAKNRLDKQMLNLSKNNIDFQLSKARLRIILSKQPEYYLNKKIADSDLTGQYQKALASIRTKNENTAINILIKLKKNHTHPWIRLALADAYTSIGNDTKALQVLSSLANLYPGYLPVTMAYANTLNNNKMPDKSITILKKQLQIDNGYIIHKALANAYFLNGQINAALESTGNQYASQGYIELAIQQYDNALKQKSISTSTRKRIEAQKKKLKNIKKDES